MWHVYVVDAIATYGCSAGRSKDYDEIKVDFTKTTELSVKTNASFVVYVLFNDYKS